MVPNGWKLTSLGEVCSGSLQTGPFGSQLHAHEYTDEGVPVLMPKDLINYRANNESAAKIPEHRADDLKKHTLRSGDLLFSRRGDVARFALIESDYPRTLCGTGCLKATPNKAHSPLFLSYFLQKNAVKKWLEQNAVGQTMPNMNTAILAELPLMVASSREEEDKIAQILSTWDKAITTTEKLIETSKQQKKALMQQLLTGKKRLVNPETGEAFEGEWEEVPLGKVTSIYDGTHSTPKYVEEGIPFYSVEHLTKNDFSNTKYIAVDVFHKENLRVKLERDDILMTRIGDIGTAKHLNWDVCASFYVSLALVKGQKDKFDSAYLCYYINSHEFHRELHKRTIHVAFPKKINLGEINHCHVLLPDLAEQQKIASVLTAADKSIEVLEAKLTHFKQEKKALMQQLLTGKRRVKVNEDVAA
ncbi:restriction endonuclease subunit S [Vibrio sp. Hep-1b-8]|uniref:restriction endonuclease subunit S n=1 Tax=Vibrio sp. Hep-1b-8 TaxID=2144187 RepID=UPI0011104B99|nr:restriction endonuclease subunit S [Vibrio sp. Hep-1b-8]